MTSSVTIKIKKKTKKKAEAFFDSYWIDLSEAIHLFLTDVAHNQKFSFSLGEDVIDPKRDYFTKEDKEAFDEFKDDLKNWDVFSLDEVKKELENVWS